MPKRRLTLLRGSGGALLIVALLLAALPLSLSAAAATNKAKPHGVAAPFGSIEFFVTEVMLQATTSTKEAPVPPVDPSKLSDAYACIGANVVNQLQTSPPCKTGDKAFTVQQDMFIPSAIVVHQGDVVALRIFDLQGHHKIYLEDPTGALVFGKFTTYAGQEYLKVFKANQLGIYRLVCETHDPTMKMLITVLRKGA